MRQKYALALAAGLPLTTVALAQTQESPPQQPEHILVSTKGYSTNTETLSGINLTPTRHGTYQLDFSQELEEDAMLQVKNTAGKVVFQKPVRKEANRSSWRYQLGRLRADTYLIEVKTSDTTYWTKFKVGK